MVSVTFSLDNKIFSVIERFPWVNWSEVSKEKLNKKRIFEEFIKTGALSEEDQKFCDGIDWYPVDELPLKKEFVKELKKVRKEPAGKAMTVEKFDKWCKKL
jgi:hypothetical protein